MGWRGLVLVLVSAAVLAAPATHAQEPTPTAYFTAVADFFRMPANEVAILAEWGLPPEEIPPALFVARQAGVSAEAILALRRSGVGWSELIGRYDVSPSALHLPVRNQAPTGALESAYALYRGTPVAEWPEIRLRDQDVLALVNVRVIAQTLRLSAEEVVRQTSPGTSYVDLFTRLSR